MLLVGGDERHAQAGVDLEDQRRGEVKRVQHARRCQACFRGSRRQLGKLGFDEAALDAMCANPDALPLDRRGRRIVHWALQFANHTPDLTPKDFREIAADGFSRDEVQEIIALAVFWVQNTMFNTAATVALTDE